MQCYWPRYKHFQINAKILFYLCCQSSYILSNANMENIMIPRQGIFLSFEVFFKLIVILLVATLNLRYKDY